MFLRVGGYIVGQVAQPRHAVAEGMLHLGGQSGVPFGLDGFGAVGKGLLHRGDDVGLGLVLVPRQVFLAGLLAAGRVGEEIVHARDVQQLLGKRTHFRRGFVVQLVLGEVLGHGDELPPGAVPPRQHRLRNARRGFRRFFLLCGLLGQRGQRREA